MTTVAVPLQQEPNQLIKVSLGGQQVIITLISTQTGMFASVNSNGADVVNSVLCVNNEPLIAASYLGFIGNLVFYDTQGKSDPVYTDLGVRYLLLYMDATDYATFLKNN